MTTTPHPESRDDLIDELASRLLDDDITLDEIDATLRASVVARHAVFSANRDRLRRETPITREEPTRSTSRSVRYTVLGLAAAAVVGVLGVAITSQGRDDDMSTADMSNSGGAAADTFSLATEAPADDALTSAGVDGSVDDVAAASMAPAAATESPATEAPEAAASPAAADMSKSLSAPLCPDPDGRPVIYTGTYEGQSVEVHFSDTDGLVVYRTSDCTAVLGIVP